MITDFTNAQKFKFKPDYAWPEPGTEKKCPRCESMLELIEKKRYLFW